MKLKCWGTRGSIPRATTHDGLLDMLSELIGAAKNKGVSNLDDF
ncbi:MAG: hypothetical protein R3B45_04205 [Bdellovibrionota bacterium]